MDKNENKQHITLAEDPASVSLSTVTRLPLADKDEKSVYAIMHF